jgi:hypothetical protein
MARALTSRFARKKAAVARKAIHFAGKGHDAGQGESAMNWKQASRIAFALTFIGIVVGVLSGFAGPIWQPVAEGTPGYGLLGYLSGLVALGCGAGLLAKPTSTVAALVLTIVLILWTAVFKLPFIFKAPLVEGSYQSNAENWVLIAAAWVLYAELAASGKGVASDLAKRIAWLLYGLALIAFGLARPAGFLGLCNRSDLHGVRISDLDESCATARLARCSREHYVDHSARVGADHALGRRNRHALAGDRGLHRADGQFVGAG